MSDKVGFYNDQNMLLAVLAGALLILLFLIFEWKRLDRSHFIIRGIVTFLAVLSLLMIYLEPYLYKLENNDLCLIFTDGSTHQDSLMAAHPNSKIIQWSDSVAVERLTSQLIIDGFGIPDYDFWKLENREIIKLKVPRPGGIIDFYYNHKVQVGEQANFNFKVRDLQGHKLRLSALGSIVDSLTIDNDTEQIADLSFTPSVDGKYVFKIHLLDSANELISAEKLPIKIMAEEKRKVLMLNKQPTFESRFLKNHLIENGHSVFARSEITTDRYNYESVGFDFKRLSQLTAEILNNFDLVILSSGAIKSLSSGQLNNLKNQVKTKGLSVMVLLDDFTIRLPSWLRYETDKLTGNDKTLSINLEGENIEVDWPGFYLKQKHLSESVIDRNDVSYVLAKPYGAGAVGITVLQNTYKLALSGKNEQYKILWNRVLSSVLKKEKSPISIEERLVFEHVPLAIDVINKEESPELKYQNELLSLRQHEFVPDRWSATIWPKGRGWQKLQNRELESWFYVYDASDWVASSQQRIWDTNRRKFINQKISDINQQKVKVPISLWWFYLLLLLSVGYLWLEPKLK